MEVLIVLVFVCLVLVTAAVVMFIMRVRAGDFEHGDRLSLLPRDARARVAAPPTAAADRDEDGGGPQ
ncbi:MAG: cytochrome oxidase [Acidobacteria bacterium]|nr:cytochrome oxidase [Acidobacteriota bacterium]